MRIRLHVVIHSEEASIEHRVKEELLTYCSSLSFSPSREQPSLNHCMEWFGTADVTEAEFSKLLSLNNDWDIYDGGYSAYGFNTKMFDSSVYYLQITTY